MKKMNRREFLALTGAAVVALSLAGCDDAPPAPPAPPAPTTSKETELLTAINKVWKEKHETGAVVHEQLTLNQDAVGVVRAYGRVFEEANENPHQPTAKDSEMLSDGSLAFAKKMQEYGPNGFAGMVCATELDAEGKMTLKYKYSCEDAAVQAFVEELLTSQSNSPTAEYISIYLPVVDGTTYMTAAIFLNDKA